MKKLFVILFILLISACDRRPQQSLNFLLNAQKQRISWKFNKPVDLIIHSSFYEIDPNPTVGRKFISLIHKAARIWRDRTGMTLFNIQESKNHPSQSTTEAVSDGISMIYWMKNWDQNRRKEQARTSNRWIGSEITEADVTINNNHHTFYDSKCSSGGNVISDFCSADSKPVSVNGVAFDKLKVHFVSLMIHELGHVLGQSHASENDSVMQPVLRSDEIRDDISELDAERVYIEYSMY